MTRSITLKFPDGFTPEKREALRAWIVKGTKPVTLDTYDAITRVVFGAHAAAFVEDFPKVLGILCWEDTEENRSRLLDVILLFAGGWEDDDDDDDDDDDSPPEPEHDPQGSGPLVKEVV